MFRKTIVSAILMAFLGTVVFAQNSLQVKYGPWVTGTDEDSFTVLWVTEDPGIAWVELEDGSRYYHEFAGRHIFERLHTVKVEGLKKGTDYAYKLGMCKLVDDSDARDPEFAGEQTSETYQTGTFDFSADRCHFSVLNDMHLEVRKYRRLVEQIDMDDTDFLFLNGDIASADNYCLDSLAHYDFDALKGYSQSLPVFFARGNHEGRGNNPKLILSVFPTETNQFYYTFRQGPVAFIVFDAGETHKERSKAYTGTEVFEKYLNEQIEWAKTAVKDPEFADAPLKICLLHVPMVDIGDDRNYMLQRWLNHHIVPQLNEAGVNLMISGDLHDSQFHGIGSMGNDFPILVNDENCRVDVDCTAEGYTLSVTNPFGITRFAYSHLK